MASTTMSPPVKGGFKPKTPRWNDIDSDAKTSAATTVARWGLSAGDIMSEDEQLRVLGNLSEEGKREFLTRIVPRMGFTEDAVMAFVEEEIHEYRKENRNDKQIRGID